MTFRIIKVKMGNNRFGLKLYINGKWHKTVSFDGLAFVDHPSVYIAKAVEYSLRKKYK